MRKRQTQTSTEAQLLHLQLLDIPQVAKALSIGRSKVYDLIRTDGLPVIRLGKAIRVSATSLQKWIERHEHAS